MGWEGTLDVACFKRDGSIDRKAEVLRQAEREPNWDVLKTTIDGSTVYMAIRDVRDGTIFAAVVQTSAQGNTFLTRWDDDTVGPVPVHCPDSILDLLSPTLNGYSIEWRAKCREWNEQKREHDRRIRALKNYPIGTVIRCMIGHEEMDFVKKDVVGRGTRWLTLDGKAYIRPTKIPEDYTLISIPDENAG